MKTKKLKQKVIHTMLEYMRINMAFTSLDICNNIRSKNPGEDIRMGEVSRLIRMNVLEISVVSMFQYEMTYITIDSSNTHLAILYHPKDYDTDNYLARDQVTIQTM